MNNIFASQSVGYRHAFPLLAITSASLLATDIYLPSLPILPEALGGSEFAAQMTLVSFFLCFGGAQLLFGVIAYQLGMVRALSIGVCVFFVGSLIACLSSSLWVLVVARGIQGFGAAAGTAIVPGIVQRVYSGSSRIKVMSLISALESLVPGGGPVAGVYLTNEFGWRANFVVMTLVLVAAAIMLYLNRGVYKSRSDRNGFMGVRYFFRNYLEIFRDPGFISLAGSCAMALAALLSFVGAAPALMVNTYGMGEMSFAWMQVVLVSVFILGGVLSGRILGCHGL